MFDPMFVPPRHNAALFGIASALLPRLAPLFGSAHAVSVPEEDLERLEGKGCVSRDRSCCRQSWPS